MNEEYRAAPRNLVLPAVLLAVAVGLFAVAGVSGLFSVGVIAFAVLVAAGFLAVRLRGHGAAPVARGPVDQPLRDPRYGDRVAEVEAAGVGRVETRHERRNVWIPALLVAVLPLSFAGWQFGTVDRPWEGTPWWPGVEVATVTPDPCAAIVAEAGRRLVPAGPESRYGGPTDPVRSCRAGDRPRITVDITRAGTGDLVAAAKGNFRRLATSESYGRPLAGLGEEAAVGGAGGPATRVVARRGNVVVEVEVRVDPGAAAPDAATVTETVTEIARHAVDLIDLR